MDVEILPLEDPMCFVRHSSPDWKLNTLESCHDIGASRESLASAIRNESQSTKTSSYSLPTSARSTLRMK